MARVLIVEDNAPYREAVRAALEMEGHEVREAHNGRDALDLLAHAPVDVVLLDLHMPILDGHGFLAERARTGTAATVPVVVLTSADGATEIEGVVAVLTKDVQAADLSRLVERLAGGAARATS